jgi:predicted transcriptional regulator
MEVVWARDSATGSEIAAVLNDGRADPVAYNTVLMICTRLTNRGLLQRQKEGRSFRYEATMDAAAFATERARKDTDALLDLHGDAAISSFVEQVSDDPKLIAQLRDLLDRGADG